MLTKDNDFPPAFGDLLEETLDHGQGLRKLRITTSNGDLLRRPQEMTTKSSLSYRSFLHLMPMMPHFVRSKSVFLASDRI